MKYVKQFLIILFISFIGELLSSFLPLPVPASIYGIVLMFSCLMLGVIKPSHIKETASFLIEIMPVMFIPAAVGLLDSWDILRPSWVAYLAITAITTVIVMAATGIVTQLVIKKKTEDKNDG